MELGPLTQRKDLQGVSFISDTACGLEERQESSGALPQLSCISNAGLKDSLAAKSVAPPSSVGGQGIVVGSALLHFQGLHPGDFKGYESTRGKSGP